MQYHKLIPILICSMYISCTKGKSQTTVNHISSDTTITDSKFKVSFPKLTKEFIESNKSYLEHFYNSKYGSDFSGGFLVAKNGQIIYEHYNGYAYKEKDIKIDEHTPIHVASVSKVITATTVLRLVDQGKVKLDQTVQSILPTFPYAETTVRMLLNHRSGMRNYAYFTDNKAIWDRKTPLTNQDVLNIMATHNIGLESRINNRFQYCNTNYVMLALIVEKVTNKTFPDAVKEMIFDPLGMTDSFIFHDMEKKDEVSQSYKSSNIRLAWEYLDVTYGDKNMFTTARDLLKFDSATYSNDFLSNEVKQEMFRGYSYERKGNKNYGLGFRLIEFERGPLYIFHNGWWHGNTASYVTLRDEKVTIISLSNKYTTKTYKTKQLASHFGDYPFEGDEGDE